MVVVMQVLIYSYTCSHRPVMSKNTTGATQVITYPLSPPKVRLPYLDGPCCIFITNSIL